MSEDQKKIINKVVLQHNDNKKELLNFQSPRGLRFADKRPNIIIIDCYMQADKILLGKYIKWLNDLYCSMQ